MATLAVVSLCSTSIALSQAPATQLSINQNPHYIYENQNFELEFLIGAYRGPPNAQPFYIVDELNIIIFYGISSGHLIISPQPPPTNDILVQSVLGLSAGVYNVFTVAIVGDEPPAEFVIREGTEPRGYVTIHPGTLSLEMGLGSPGPGEVVGGFGTIRGWACYPRQAGAIPGTIGKVSYQVDTRAIKPVLYGSPRGDTAERCGGNVENGFAAPINWNRFSLGEHTFTLYVDGEEAISHDVVVSGTGETYLRELEAEYELSNFPRGGDTTTVQWSQSAQDFTIIGVERD